MARITIPWSVSVSDSQAVMLNDGQISVEGFDPATGATTWSWTAGNVLGLVAPR